MLRLRGMDAFTFARAVTVGRRPVPHPSHVFLCVADHFEPDWRSASVAKQRERVARWVDGYRRSVASLSDSRGRPPQHTFFFPMECYRAEWIESLCQLVRSGHGDIEVHLHHDDDSSGRLHEFLLDSVQRLRDHGLLSADSSGQLRYGFIHGNWALDNSHPAGRWCGINDELTILRQTGCYADFTMPAAPDPAQTRTINSIYYAIDDPHRPKSHDTGVAAEVGARRVLDGLLMIQGPLLVTQTRFWSKPRVENGNLAGTQPPTAERIDDWLRAGVSVKGHEKWSFIKLHTHGAQEQNADMLLGPGMHQFHQALKMTAARRSFEYFYVTAREMAQLVIQAEQGFATPDFDRLTW